MPASLLTVENLAGGYGPLQVLWDLNLRVEEGEVVSLIGANGAGKTTTLRLISGLQRPFKGTVAFRGRPLAGCSAAEIARLGISHVPEGRKLFPRMTVKENLELGASYFPAAWRERNLTRDYLYGLFPRLREREQQLAGTLSGGEQQMLAIARALMAKPQLLLVDEPSLGLAPAVVAAVFKSLREVNKQGVAILLVEQDVQRSLVLAHRGYVLENGRIVGEGTGAELLADERVRKAYLAL
ncbi:MAG: ABC transporter ATP-binding protein [Bacillota bacterium]